MRLKFETEKREKVKEKKEEIDKKRRKWEQIKPSRFNKQYSFLKKILSFMVPFCDFVFVLFLRFKKKVKNKL